MLQVKYEGTWYSSPELTEEFTSIARDRSGEVCAYIGAPKRIKSFGFWVCAGEGCRAIPLSATSETQVTTKSWDDSLYIIPRGTHVKYRGVMYTASNQQDLTGYKYIARDYNGEVYAYKEKPLINWWTDEVVAEWDAPVEDFVLLVPIDDWKDSLERL